MIHPKLDSFSIFLETERVSRNIISAPVEALALTDSTNARAKDFFIAASALETATGGALASPLSQNFTTQKFLVADQQTHGRGRGQHTWTNSQSGTCLLCSWLYRLPKAPSHLLAPRLGLAIYEALKQNFVIPQLSLKAPNDFGIKISGGNPWLQKMGGILVELVSHNPNLGLVIGLGLNVFASPGLPNATHLAAHCEVTREKYTNFFSQLNRYFARAIELSLQKNDQLSSIERQDLQSSLGHPDLATVSPDCDLNFSNSWVKWSEL